MSALAYELLLKLKYHPDEWCTWSIDFRLVMLSGEIVCQAEITDIGETSESIDLQIEDTPSVRLEPLQNTTTVGESAELYCEVDNVYSLEDLCIVWYRNGTEHDRECKASKLSRNSFGAIMVHTFYITYVNIIINIKINVLDKFNFNCLIKSYL